MTDSMIAAIDETDRRRGIQSAHNKLNNIIPQSIVKTGGNSILQFLDFSRRLNSQQIDAVVAHVDEVSLEQIPDAIVQLEVEMKKAAKDLDFEKAATLRDRIKQLRSKLVGNSSEIKS